MVRAKLSGSHTKKARKFHNSMRAIECTGDTDLLLNNLDISLQNGEKENECISIQEKYTNLLQQLKSETKKVNMISKTEISLKSKQLLQERKELIQQRKNNNNSQKMSEISKEISKQLRKERKEKRLTILKKHIQKSGGIRKARKELNHKKDWILNMKDKDKRKTCKRSEILGIATDYYKKLYQSRKVQHVIKEYNSVNKEKIEPILKEETIKSIESQN
ncbi:hypothetical protein EVAR_19626_1 [Eumeta japonica]|uniref:Uncharacterized protein n=1 Tax=Eumeta variegata TaxID=151549 RepID=A0A4C1UGU4_EUMVA|nr:hypothetical protein EVAR_19626_1 [Eumeta japonica]